MAVEGTPPPTAMALWEQKMRATISVKDATILAREDNFWCQKIHKVIEIREAPSDQQRQQLQPFASSQNHCHVTTNMVT